MNFLFWNLNKNNETFPHLVKIVNEEEIDVIALAEFPTDENSISELEELLNRNGSYSYLEPLAKDKVKLFYKTPRVDITNQYDGQKINVKCIQSSGVTIYAIFCHLGSKINNTDDDQHHSATKFKQEIEEFEESKNNYNTIICGDFNMNPFEKGMVDSEAFHAIMDKKIALRISRTVEEEEHKFFYNPMWGCLGDNGKGKFPGTHYFNPSKSMQYFWNIYDQILIRPNVIDYFDDNKLKIVTKGVNYNLLTRSGLMNQSISDHLPIMFNLNI